MSSLLQNLNEAQIRAVTAPEGDLLVLAGAGSGKTRVLTTRIAWLLEHQGLSPERILAVTFTNKAAQEIKTRLAALSRLRLDRLWVGTFHSLCHRLLRLHGRDIGLGDGFVVIDNSDQHSLIKRLIHQLGLDDKRYPPRAVQAYINQHKEAGRRVADVSDNGGFYDCYALYEASCRAESVVDFAELLLAGYTLLCRNEELRQHYQQRFRHLLVDEVQDASRLQWDWLLQLAGQGPPQTSIFAVGDDDQSIYGFRGADVGELRRFADQRAAEVIRLERNYRSLGTILDAANALIANNARRLGKELWTEADAGDAIRLHVCASDHEEADVIADEVEAALRRGQSADGIALLYRSNRQSRLFEQALIERQIAYRVYGGLRFFDRQEVKHLLAYARLLVLPHDNTAFLRVVNIPPRGIGAKTIERLQNAASSHGLSYYQTVANQLISGRSHSALCAFTAWLESAREQTKGLSLADTFTWLLRESGLAELYQGDHDGEERLAHLQELIEAAAGFAHVPPGDIAEPSGESAPLLDFLSYSALESGEAAQSGEASVSLMTVHAAKGLEFDLVMVTGLEQGLFPHSQSLDGGDHAVEEERRLMYVAMTRAKKQLHLSYALCRTRYGQIDFSQPSQFLREIPDAILQRSRGTPAFAPHSANPVASHHGSAPASFTRTAAAAQGPTPHWLGKTVSHPRFGHGVVVDVEGSGSDQRLKVAFANEGDKWLLSRASPLTVVG